jgi:hypothetical protein
MSNSFKRSAHSASVASSLLICGLSFKRTLSNAL